MTEIMYDQNSTKDQLFKELEQLRKENNSLKGLIGPYTTELGSQGIPSKETMLALVMQSANEKMTWWEINIPSGKLFFDHRKAEVLGYPPDQFKYFSEFTALIHPDDYQRVTEAVNGCMEGVLDKLEVEYRVKTQSGEYVWLYKYGSIIKYDDMGKPLICAGFVHNITERKQVEEELFKSKQMFQTLMDNFPGVIFWKDTQLHYLGCNKTFAAGVGFNHTDQLVGKTDKDLPWAANYAEKFQSEDRIVIQSDQPLMHLDELQFKPKNNGQVSWFDKSKIPLHDSQGQVIGLMGVAIDISRIKTIEQQLIEANKKLMFQNMQKAQYAEELNQALHKAEESDLLKSEFLANMSHEIRTPMNSILGFAELLKDPDIEPIKQQEFLYIIEKSVERMLNIINDIVDFSKIESGQMELYLSELNVNQEIEKVCNLYYPEALSKGLRILIKNTLPSHKAIIKTDKDKFRAILSNLLKNSIKFTKAGTIEMGYEKRGDHLEFFVKDTGIGVTEAQKPLIFKRFRQGSESENKKYEGAGLGLSISKAYVELLGGKIWVDNNFKDQPERGSTFYFTLPLQVEIEETKADRKLTGAR